MNNVKGEITNVYYPVNSTINYTIPCINNNTLCSSSATCSLYIYYSNDTLLKINQTMKNSNGLFSYVLYPNETETKGVYKSYVFCQDGAIKGYSLNQYTITGFGRPPASNGLEIFIWFLFMLSFVLLILGLIMMIVKFVDITIYDVLLSWGGLFLSYIVLYLSQNYLITTYIENWVLFLLKITIWSNGYIPALMLFVSIIFNWLGIKKADKKGDKNGR